MLSNLKKYNVILASKSPRRKELLSQIIGDFKVLTISGIDESYPSGLEGEEVALHIAGKKAAAYLESIGDNDLIITADTIVCVDNEVLGKPENAEDARRMLRLLSGRQHKVVTAFAVSTKGRIEKQAVTTLVRFAELTEEIIDHYIENYKPFDKAGAYGIQEWIGYVGVEEVQGSFFNVIGLPVQRVFKVLQTF